MITLVQIALLSTYPTNLKSTQIITDWHHRQFQTMSALCHNAWLQFQNLSTLHCIQFIEVYYIEEKGQKSLLEQENGTKFVDI
jgi:hypothetical protein